MNSPPGAISTAGRCHKVVNLKSGKPRRVSIARGKQLGTISEVCGPEGKHWEAKVIKIFVRFDDKKKFDRKNPFICPDCENVNDAIQRYIESEHLEDGQRFQVCRYGWYEVSNEVKYGFRKIRKAA